VRAVCSSGSRADNLGCCHAKVVLPARQSVSRRGTRGTTNEGKGRCVACRFVCKAIGGPTRRSVERAKPLLHRHRSERDLGVVGGSVSSAPSTERDAPCGGHCGGSPRLGD
jgi:hypothetical protein